jgi:hypothetical protein
MLPRGVGGCSDISLTERASNLWFAGTEVRKGNEEGVDSLLFYSVGSADFAPL